MENPRTRHTRILAAIACLATVAIGPSPAGARDALVRWQPSPSRGVVAYRVWVRQAGTPYGPPHAAGHPDLAPDGSMSYAVRRLDDAATHHFAVSARTADGLESPLSQELALGPTNACLNDRCTAVACDFSPLPDGTSCGASADPCTDVCAAGQCRTVPAGTLATGGLRLRQRQAGVRLRARGTFASDHPLDPSASGLTVLLQAEDGSTLLREAIAGRALRPNRAGTRFRYRPRPAPSLGLQALRLARRAGDWRLTVEAMLPALPAPASTELALSLLLAGECLRGNPLPCRAGRRATSCRPPRGAARAHTKGPRAAP